MKLLLLFSFLYSLINVVFFIILFKNFLRFWLKVWKQDYWVNISGSSIKGVPIFWSQFFLVIIISLVSWFVFRGLVAISAYTFATDLTDMVTISRGVFDLNDKFGLQNPLDIGHILGGLVFHAIAQIAAIAFLINAIRWSFIHILEKLKTRENYNMDEEGVAFWAIIGVFAIIVLEIFFNIQVINIQDDGATEIFMQILHSLFSVVKSFSFIIIFFGLYHFQLLKYDEKYPTFFLEQNKLNNVENFLYTNPFRSLNLMLVVVLFFNTPLYSGIYFLGKVNIYLLLYLGVLSLIYLTFRKLIYKGYNLIGETYKLNRYRPYLPYISLNLNKRFLVIAVVLIALDLLLMGVFYFSKLTTFAAANLIFIALVGLISLVVSLFFLGWFFVPGLRVSTIRVQVGRNILAIFKITNVLFTYPIVLFLIGFSLNTFFPKRLNQEFIGEMACTGVLSNVDQAVLFQQSGDSLSLALHLTNIPEFTQRVLLSFKGEDQFFRQQQKPFNYTSNSNGVNLKMVFSMIFEQRGGSNINNQLVKNILYNGGSPKDMARKWAEQLGSYALTVSYTPEEILNYYFNIVYATGKGSHRGWEKSALHEFGRPLNSLNHLEQIYHIKTLKSRTYVGNLEREDYLKNPNQLKDSLMYTVDLLYGKGVISELEYAQIKGETLRFNEGKFRSPLENSTRLFFTEQLKRLDSTSRLTAFTNYSLSDNTKVEKGVSRFKIQLGGAVNVGGMPLHYAAVVLNYKTGEIVGHSSSGTDRDYSQFSNGFPIGSTIKPLLFAEYLHQGGKTSDTFYDGQRGNTPKNYSGKFSNEMKSIPIILKESLNAPVANMYKNQGGALTFYQRVEAQFKKMGIKDDKNLSFTDKAGILRNYPIGQSRQMQLLDLAQCYQALLNDGEFVKISAFTHTFNMATNRLDTLGKKKNQIWKIEAAKAIKSFLKEPLEPGGTAAHLKNLLPGRIKYAKTGTTDSYQHGWVMLASDNHVLIAWVSYNPENSTAAKLQIPNKSGGKSAGYLGAFILNEMKLN